MYWVHCSIQQNSEAHYEMMCVLLVVDVGKLTVSMDKDIVLAPTKEVLSLRAYTVMSQMNQLRRASCQLYQQMSMTQVVEKLECEIETGRLAVRTDCMLHADLGTVRLHLQNHCLLIYYPEYQEILFVIDIRPICFVGCSIG